MSDGYTMVRLRKATVERLREIGKKGDTYDDIVKRLLECYEKSKN